MKAILNDATSFLLANELLKGNAKPTALNIFNLSNIVESIVLHEQIVVIGEESTNPDLDKYLRNAMQCLPKDIISILENSGREYSCNYGRMTKAVLHQSGRQKDLKTCKKVLHSVYDHYFEKTSKPKAVEVRALICLIAAFFEPKRFNSSYYGTTLNAYLPFELSGFPADFNWSMPAFSNYSEFEKNIFYRTSFYLEVAENLDVLYKPDFLRSPSMFALYGKASPINLAAEEMLIRLATQYEDKRNSILNQFMQNQSLLLMTPLIVRAILKEARHREDVLKLAIQMRETNSAKRFRTACAKLNDHILNEEFEAALHELQTALKNLSFEISSPPNETIYSLLAIPTVGIKGMASPATSANIGLGTLVKTGKGFFNWWQQRKYSFVSKVIDQARKAKSLNSKIKRVFNQQLEEGEISLLQTMESINRK